VIAVGIFSRIAEGELVSLCPFLVSSSSGISLHLRGMPLLSPIEGHHHLHQQPLLSLIPALRPSVKLIIALHFHALI